MRKIALIIIAACGMISAGCCHCGKAPEKDMAVQLYSARDLIGSAELYAQNHEQVLKAIARLPTSRMVSFMELPLSSSRLMLRLQEWKW